VYIRAIEARQVQEISKSRRRMLLLAGVLATGAALLALAVTHSSDAASAAKRASASLCPKHPPPYIKDSFPEPKFQKSRNGVLDSKLTADIRKARINGKKYTTSVYNGMYPGPTFMLCPGDTWNLTFHNHLKASDFPGFDEDGMAGMTNIHTHGFHVSPQRPQDNVFVKVRPGGDTYHYHYQLPNHERPGDYWYHPHMHTQANVQELGGMEGAIIMRGGLDSRPAYQGFGQRLFDITQTSLGNGKTVQPGPHGPFLPKGTKMFVNGHLNPKVPIHPGEIQRWQIDNLNADSFVKLKLRGHAFQLLARDGNYVPRRRKKHVLLISPSSRREVLVRAGEKKGKAKLVAARFQQFGPGSKTDPQTLATLVTRGRRVDDRMPPKRVHKFHDLRSEGPVQERHRIVYTQDPPNFFINGKKFNPQRVDETETLQHLNQWTIINKTPFWHTFHIHIQDFQVIERNGHKVHGINQQDNTSVSPNGMVKLLTFPRHYTGKFVFHCHILGHEDNGMMGAVRVVKPGKH
jgi:suppressor of ftsI